MNPNLSLSELMKEAEKMQQRMQEAQKQLAELTVTGKAGGNMVEAEMNGRHEVRHIKIHASLMEEGPEMIGELVAAAINDAVRKVEKASQQKIGELTAGLNLPTDLLGDDSKS